MNTAFDVFELIITAPENFEISTAQRNRKILFDAYAAIQMGDQNALFECCAPDIVFYEAESLPYGGVKHGIDGVREGLLGAFSAWSHVRCDFQEFTAAGDIVIAYMQVALTARTTGEVYKGPTAEMFRFRDGKITEWRVIYWDTHRVRQVFGLT